MEITHPRNVNSKLAFHKVASFHQNYSIFVRRLYLCADYICAQTIHRRRSSRQKHTRINYHKLVRRSKTFSIFLMESQRHLRIKNSNSSAVQLEALWTSTKNNVGSWPTLEKWCLKKMNLTMRAINKLVSPTGCYGLGRC